MLLHSKKRKKKNWNRKKTAATTFKEVKPKQHKNQPSVNALVANTKNNKWNGSSNSNIKLLQKKKQILNTYKPLGIEIIGLE